MFSHVSVPSQGGNGYPQSCYWSCSKSSPGVPPCPVHCHVWGMGVPQTRTGPNGTGPGRMCGADGMPLAFAQEDFLAFPQEDFLEGINSLNPSEDVVVFA